MSATHLSLDDIGRVLDGDGADCRAHLRECAQCAAALQREASLDEDVSALAPRFCPGCARPGDAGDGAARCSYCGVAFAPGGLRVESVLAESDHGRLYLAHGDDGPVALKEIVFARVPDVEALERFEREARLLKQLRHERIPRFVASFSEGEGVHLRLYLAQQYVDGPALLDEIETRRFDERDARQIAREVLAILVELQALSPPVLHRDIKPANLVRDSQGKLALVDFGSARDVQKTTGGTLVGTFGYMPVEQLTGVVDESTDVYALGATLVHLLTRRPPWESAPVPSSLAVSASFRAFLTRCLAPRQKRFANARDALAALDGNGTGKRRTLGLAAVAAVVVAAGAGGPLAYRALHDADVVVAPPPRPPAAPLTEQEDAALTGLTGEERELAQRLMRAKVDVQPYIGDVVACGRRSDYNGVVNASWTITSDGTTLGVTVKGDDAGLVQCLTRAIKTWTFERNDGGIFVEMPFDFAGASDVRKAVSNAQKITVDLQDAEMSNVIRLIADVSGKPFVFGDGVHGKVTMKLKNIPWDQALDEILRTHGLVAHEHNGIITVTPMAVPRTR